MLILDYWTQPNTNRAQLMYDQLSSNFCQHYNKEMMEVFARDISNTLHDMTPIWTNYMSQKSVIEVCDGSKKLSELTDEHFLSRQQSGREIIQYFLQHDPTFNQFLVYITNHRLVHKVLPYENHNLVKYQRQYSNWKEAYYYAGIELIKIDMEGKKRCTRTRVERYRDVEPTNYSDIEQELHSSLPTEAT